ncbi:MAG TPA: hypothetical protein VF137_04025 [Candidatus Dormibacteraeota bacterium]
MRLSPGDPRHIEHLQAQIEALLEEDWKGRPAEELAEQLKKLRKQIVASTTVYQMRMRLLQRGRAEAS